MNPGTWRLHLHRSTCPNNLSTSPHCSRKTKGPFSLISKLNTTPTRTNKILFLKVPKKKIPSLVFSSIKDTSPSVHRTHTTPPRLVVFYLPFLPRSINTTFLSSPLVTPPPHTASPTSIFSSQVCSEKEQQGRLATRRWPRTR